MQLPPFGSFRNRFPAPSLWCWGGHVGTSTSSAFRVFASLTFAVRFRRRRSVAPLGATRRHSGDPLPAVSLCFVAPASFGRRFRNVLFSPPHVGGSNSCKLACHGSASPHGTPPCFGRYEKGGRFPVPLMGSNSYSSNPATTVSSVELSNAFAASVTGK